MNAAQALSAPRTLLGKHAAIKDRRRPSSPDARALAHEAHQAANIRKQAAAEALIARREELLAADAEYQRLRAEFEEARRAQENAGGFGYYRYSAGTVGSMFFSVKAEADTLAELIDKVRAEAKTQAIKDHGYDAVMRALCRRIKLI